jgi:hypothetical protein
MFGFFATARLLFDVDEAPLIDAYRRALVEEMFCSDVDGQRVQSLDCEPMHQFYEHLDPVRLMLLSRN